MIKKLIFLIIVLVLSSFMVSSVQTVIPGINRTVFYDPDGAGYVKGINREEINYNCLTCSANTSSINLSDYAVICELGNYSFFNGSGFECSPDLQGSSFNISDYAVSCTIDYVSKWNGTMFECVPLDIGFVKYENNTQNVDVGGFNITNVYCVGLLPSRMTCYCANGNIIIGDSNLTGVYC